MSHIDGPFDPTRMVPGRLEREAAKDLVNILPDFLHPPAGPGPELRRDEVEDRDAACLGPAGDPPVQAGIVDQHHRIRPLVAEIAIGHEDEADERHQVEQHVEEPHHREVDQREEQARTGLRHLRAAETDEPGVRNPLSEGTDQVGGVEIAAGLSGRDEDSHEVTSLPCAWTAVRSIPDTTESLSERARTEKANHSESPHSKPDPRQSSIRLPDPIARPIHDDLKPPRFPLSKAPVIPNDTFMPIAPFSPGYRVTIFDPGEKKTVEVRSCVLCGLADKRINRGDSLPEVARSCPYLVD